MENPAPTSPEPAAPEAVITVSAAEPADVTVTSQTQKPASKQVTNYIAGAIAVAGALVPVVVPAVGPALAAANVAPWVISLVTSVGAVVLAAYQEKVKLHET